MTSLLWTLAFLTGIGLFAFQLYGRFKVLFQMRKDDGRDYSMKTWGKRFKNVIYYAMAQRKFFRDEQPAGGMHIVIFWGFIVLALQVVTMFLRGWYPYLSLPGFESGPIANVYNLTKDIFQFGVLIAIGVAFFRWSVIRPKRLYGILPAEEKLSKKSHAEAYLILCFISTIMLSGFFYDAGRIGADPSNPNHVWSPISHWISKLYAGRIPLGEQISAIAWWVHNLVILSFLNLLPLSKHFHIITSIPNVFLGKLEPRGKLPKKDYTADNALFGRSMPQHFTWKQTLDMYSCTECGRCAAVCPAAATGKPLAPRQFLVDLRDNLYKLQAQLNKKDGWSKEYPVVVGDDKAVIDEVIWSCVTCRACEEACPVNIEYVDKIIDIRNHLTQEASRFPSELNRAFQGMERNSNPWGIAATERASWAEGLDVPTIAEKPDAEYLYYVGCGGSFDSNHKKSTQSLVKILKEAGVSFAILGTEETCNGETARRLGNEYLYQTMAEALAQKINSYGIKKLLVNCPHCFNTMKNEYPDFGGDWNVQQAAGFVAKLKEEGKIQMKKEFKKDIVYHDSCYYSRYNDVMEAPRNLINSVPGANLLEMDNNKLNSVCCGAGGGRMWLEEKADQRVNVMRTEQALAKNPEIVATSCPFCRVMMSSGVNEKGMGEKVQVMDVMEIVANNMETRT